MNTRARGQFVARVAANQALCREHYRLTLAVDAFPVTEPGQFVQIACRAMEDDASPGDEIDDSAPSWRGAEGRNWLQRSAYLRRPFSLAGRRDTVHGAELEFIHRVVGVGTDWLSRLRQGDRVHLLGPLGNRFALPADDHTAVLVGGGVGIPPMLYLANALQGRRAIAFCGALSRDLLPLTIDVDAAAPGTESIEPRMDIAEFARHGIPSVISTDDGSYGFRGYVTQALEQYLDAALVRAPAAIIYTCGPEPMMRRVATIAQERGIECQIAVERAMACGMGTCQSCCIRVRKPDPNQPPLAGREWCWRLACTDGPVFRGSQLLW